MAFNSITGGGLNVTAGAADNAIMIDQSGLMTPDNDAPSLQRVYDIDQRAVNDDIKFAWGGREITVREIADKLQALEQETKEGYFNWNGQQIHVGQMAEQLQTLEAELNNKKTQQDMGQDFATGDIIQPLNNETTFGKIQSFSDEWNVYVEWLISPDNSKPVGGEVLESIYSLQKASLEDFIIALQQQQSNSDNPINGDIVTLDYNENIFGRVMNVENHQSVMVEWEINPHNTEPNVGFYNIENLKKASLREFVTVMQQQQEERLTNEAWEREEEQRKEASALASQLGALDKKLLWEKEQLTHELRFHQKKTLSMEEKFEQALRRIEELERKGSEQEEIQRIEQEEVLPVLASMSKTSAVGSVLRVAREFGKQFIIKEIIRLAQANGLNLDWLVKMLGF